MISTADRINTVEEYYFSKKLKEIASRIENGEQIINLGIGSPDLKPPESVIEELNNVSKLPNAHGYQSYRGIPALRKAFSKWYGIHYGVKLNSETEILPLIGSKEGIMHISMTYLQPGDQVLIPNPGYPTYAAAAKLAGAQVVTYDLSENNNYQPDIDALEANYLTNLKLMWVNYPHMPSGQAADAQLFKKLTDFAEKNEILIVNDNPYSFILNEQPQSIFSK